MTGEPCCSQPSAREGPACHANFSSAKQTDELNTKGTQVREQLQGDGAKRYILFVVKVGLPPTKTCLRETKSVLVIGSKFWTICLSSFPYMLLVFSYSL